MIPTLPFGRTNHLSTRIIFGGFALAYCTQAEADRTLELLFEYGINHIDTAANYGDSELRIGPWMPRYRDRFFLATKTQERTYSAARDQIRRSLDRLQTDHLDLIQLHYLVDETEWQVAMGAGGALEAAIDARAEGLVRYIGVTGHDLIVVKRHMQSLERFTFDSILLPYNYLLMQNAEYASGFKALMATCAADNIAVQTIKSIARGLWQHSAPRHASVWYEPLTEQAHIDLAVHWVLSRPNIFLNTVGDLNLLPKVLDAAKRFESTPSEEAMQNLMREAGITPMFS
ncbi:MAG: aldo/keto reductase [Chloroflexi bacterium CFX4]|nr:aldo/keto reductase [Chloroflexi bacterium CFX4]MDL1924485.1 aldo/keto reductase [Chloroflexi bacterium CFX3]